MNSNAPLPLLLLLTVLLLADVRSATPISMKTTSTTEKSPIITVITPSPPASAPSPSPPTAATTAAAAAPAAAAAEKAATTNAAPPPPPPQPPLSLSLPAAQPVGRGFYKSDDDDYPTAHSGHDAGLYSAGHSADAHSSWADAVESTGPDHHHPDSHPHHQHHHSSSGIENPSYDPTLYHSFVPQEHVQQYLTAYSGGHPYEDMHMPTYVLPGWPAPPGAISVHDYVVHPTAATTTTTTAGSTTAAASTTVATTTAAPTVLNVVAQALPRSLVVMLLRSAGFLLSTLGIIAFGGVITTAVCALTPLCTITFIAPFVGLRQTAASTLQKVLGDPTSAAAAAEASASAAGNGDGGGETGTGARIARAAQLVGSAIAKYKRMQADGADAWPN